MRPALLPQRAPDRLRAWLHRNRVPYSSISQARHMPKPASQAGPFLPFFGQAKHACAARHQSPAVTLAVTNFVNQSRAAAHGARRVNIHAVAPRNNAVTLGGRERGFQPINRQQRRRIITCGTVCLLTIPCGSSLDTAASSLAAVISPSGAGTAPAHGHPRSDRPRTAILQEGCSMSCGRPERSPPRWEALVRPSDPPAARSRARATA